MNAFAFSASYDFDHVPIDSLVTPPSFFSNFFAISMHKASRSPGTLRARIVTGGLILAGLIGGGYSLKEFNSAGKESPTASVVAQETHYAFVTGTGSSTIKYPAECIPIPLASLSPSQGSGIVLRLQYEAGNNPAGVGGDIGFVKSCGDAGGSGSTIIDNVCTSTDCVSTYTTGTALWNGADYIKFTPRANLTAGYTGRIKVWYSDVLGE